MPAPLVLCALLTAGQAASQPASLPASMPAEGPASQPAGDVEEAAPAQRSPSPAEPPTPADAEGSASEDAASPTLLDRVFGPDEGRAMTAGLLTSRPGFSESAATVQPGGVLVNVSLGMLSTIDDGLLLSAAALDAPAVTLRIGVLDYLELRVGGSWRLTAARPDTDFDTPPPVSAGVAQVTVGGTVRLLEERGYLPGLAVLIAGDLPLQDLRLGGFSARGLAAIHKDFFGRFGLGANLGAGWDGLQERFHFPYTAIASLTIGLGIGVYAEVFGDVYTDQLPSVWADGGLYYDVTDGVRIDALLGVNALGSQGTWLAQTGLSWLL